MEDKRTLLAFLIIGLILLGMPYYFEWMGITQPATHPPESVNTESTPPKADGQIASSVPPPSVAQPQPELRQSPPTTGEVVSPRNLVVHTPLQQLVFSTSGGNLISAQLLRYSKEAEKKKVELIPEGARVLALTLKNRETETDLSTTGFVPDKEDLLVEAGKEGWLSLRADLGGGRSVEKVFHFYGNRYGIDMELRFSGLEEDTEALLTWDKGIAVTEQKPEIDQSEMRALVYMNGELTEFRVKDKDKEPWSDKGPLKWIGVRNKYFLSAMTFSDEEQLHLSLSGRLAAETGREYTYHIGAQINDSRPWKSMIYLGPLDYEALAYYQVDLERAMSLGWPVVREISKLLLVIFVVVHEYVPNYGWVIVLFSLVVKVLVYPLTHKSYESAAKMQEVQPKLMALREKYKNDNQRLSRETMALYKEAGVNPLGGCLPILLQMPIFFALYQVFSTTIELRRAPFILWINDLSLPDEVIIGGFGVHILPVLMALSMMIQQKMTMKDPRQAALVYLMPLLMIFIFWKLSSGLVLYWTVFNVLTIGQQWLIDRLKKRTAASVVDCR